LSLPAPVIVKEGIPCYAPELLTSDQDYPGDNFAAVAGTEDQSFWFRSRNRLIKRLVARYLGADPARMLDLGCGNGYVLQTLAALPNVRLTGAEQHWLGLVQAKKRLPQIDFVQVDARRLPFIAAFDAIGAFDVLEHIEKDTDVMSSIFRALKPGGYLFATVPQHPFLWSETDRLANHKRRYRRSDLMARIRQAGMAPVYCRSFVSLLFPAMLASRLFSKQNTSERTACRECELRLPAALDSIFGGIMKIEEALLAWGIRFPFGGSLLLAARKPGVAAS
jgi:SAM-dependent methyltransferase